VDHFGSQVPRSTKSPPTGPQRVVCLLHLDIHVLPPSQPIVQGHPQILDRLGTVQSNSKEKRFKKPGSFLFLVNMTRSVSSGLTDKPTLPHHVSTVWRALCMSSDTVFGNFSTASRQMSSALPWQYTPPILSLAIKSSTTRHHKSGDNTPLWGQPLDTATLTNVSLRAAVVRQPSRVALTHRTLVELTPCPMRAAQKV
jgi:hypothetical protein